MPDMKEYLVTMDDDSYTFIVSAKNAKDAIAQVWEAYFEWRNEEIKEANKRMKFRQYRLYTKSELSARSLGSLHNEQGKIICL